MRGTRSAFGLPRMPETVEVANDRTPKELFGPDGVATAGPPPKKYTIFGVLKYMVTKKTNFTRRPTRGSAKLTPNPKKIDLVSKRRYYLKIKALKPDDSQGQPQDHPKILTYKVSLLGLGVSFALPKQNR